MSDGDSNTSNMDLNKISTFFHIPVTQLNIFDEDSLITLQQKLQDYDDLQNINIELNSKIGKIRTDYERNNDLQLVVEQLTEDNIIFRTENNNLASKLSSNEQIIELNELKTHIKEQEQTKTDLVKLLNEKINEISRMEFQITTTLESKKDQMQKYQRIIDELGETQSDNLLLQTELEKTKHLLGDSDRKRESLISQLENKDQQFKDYRTTKEKIISKSVNDLLTCKNDLKEIKENNSALSKKYDPLSKEIKDKDGLIEELKFMIKITKEEHYHETNSQKELIRVLEGQVKNFQEKLNIEFGTSELSLQQTEDFDELSQELSTLKKRLEYSEQERAHLEAYVNQLMLNEENGTTDDSENDNIKLQSDITLLKERLKNEISVREYLEHQIQLFVSDLQEKYPTIDSFKDKKISLQTELTNVSLLLEHTSNDNNAKIKMIHEKDKEITELNDSLDLLKNQRRHLANQVKYLLINMEIYENGNRIMTKDEETFLKSILDDEGNEPEYNNDTSLVIVENAEKFRNILELQQQNMKLLSTVDQLSSRAEYLETLNHNMESDSEGEIIQDAKEAILTLEARNSYLERRLTAIENTTTNPDDLAADNLLIQSNRNEDDKHAFDKTHLKTIGELQQRLQVTIDDNLKIKTSLQNKLQETANKLSKSSLNFEMEKSKNELINQKLIIANNSTQLFESDNSELTLRNNHLKENLDTNEKTLDRMLREQAESKAELTTLKLILENNESEKEILSKDRDHFKDNMYNVKQERNSLTIELSKARATLKEKESFWSVKDTTYKEAILNLEEKLSQWRKRLEVKNDELRDLINSKEKETEWYKVKIESSNIEVNMLKNSILERSTKIEHLLSDLTTLQNEIVDKDVAISSYKRIINNGEKSAAQEKLEIQLNETQQSLNDTLVESEKYKTEITEAQTSLQNMSVLYEHEKQAVKDLEISLDKVTKDSSQNKEVQEKSIKELKLELDNQKGLLGEKEAQFQTKLLEIEKIGVRHNESYEANISDLTEELEKYKITNNEMQQKYLELFNKYSGPDNTTQDHQDNTHIPDIKLEIDSSQVESLQNMNRILQERVEKSETRCNILTEQIITSQNKISSLKTQLNKINELNNDKDDQLKTSNEGSGDLKSSSVESVNIGDLAEVNDQSIEMSDLLKKNEELEDRFNRLKKQAHERLNNSKLASESLSSQMETLKEENIQLSSKLQGETTKTSSLEQKVKDFNDGRSEVVTELQRELEYTKIHSKEIEYKLNDTMETSNKLIEKLNVEINNLKSELEEAKMAELGTIVPTDETDEYGKVIENMRKLFEDEKIQFVKDQTEEYNKKLKHQENMVDIESLKKQWNDENENIVLKRIQEANENLKKEIKAPSDDEINRCISDHKNELDKEFGRKVEEKAKELIETPEFEKIKEQIQSEIQNKLESAHADDLQEVKRKSFEEGQQQVSMKLTFLQKKISSLESQLNEDKEGKDAHLDDVGNSTDVTEDNDNTKDFEVDKSLKSQHESTTSLRVLTPSPFKVSNSPFTAGSDSLSKGVNPTNVDAAKNPFSASFDLSGSSPSAINPFSKFQPTFSFGKQENQNSIDESSQNSSPSNKRTFEEEEDDSIVSSESKKSKND